MGPRICIYQNSNFFPRKKGLNLIIKVKQLYLEDKETEAQVSLMVKMVGSSKDQKIKKNF